MPSPSSPGGGIFATISEVRDIKGPNETTAIFLREWINGLIDPGSLDFTANYLPKEVSHA